MNGHDSSFNETGHKLHQSNIFPSLFYLLNTQNLSPFTSLPTRNAADSLTVQAHAGLSYFKFQQKVYFYIACHSDKLGQAAFTQAVFAVHTRWMRHFPAISDVR